ncbi:MAG: D-2-hydroxyacid dehydrogenase [Sinobacteraceae bacterium]|nr:D-2-hydroxyacid dehydrogenase [Nevskiaceae bacterium]
MARVVYIGTPEADADTFQQRVRADIPAIDLFATNERNRACEHLEHCEVLIGHHFQFDDPLLAQAARLKWIQSLTSGTDAIVKLPSLRPDVLITSTRGIHGPQMSEIVFLHMLALTRNFPRMLENQRESRWERWVQPLLHGKTAVIVGVGAIAETLAPRCRAFGMQAFGVTASPREVAGFDRMFHRTELVAAAALADYLIIIVPYSADTDNLIDDEVVRALRPSAYLINVARGAVLDEVALMAALNEGRLAGAALDVFRETPLPPSSPLWQQKKLLITPLVGGMSDVYLDQCYPVVRHNLQVFLQGRNDLVNLVRR